MADKDASSLSEAARRALSEFDQVTTAHKEFVRRYENNRKAYEAVLDMTSEAAQWTHKEAPPYAEHIIETTIASMLDEQLRFRVRPANRLFFSPDEVKAQQDAAQAWQILLDAQLRASRFDEVQRPLVLQERLAGLSPVKVYWREDYRPRQRTTWTVDPLTGLNLWGVTDEQAALRDGPCAEPVDVRDFFWDDEATSLDDSGILVHRTWPTWEECKRMERAGLWRNVDELPSTRNLSQNLEQREGGSPDIKRGRLEVLEIWRREDTGQLRVYTIGQRSVLLSERDNRFQDGDHPFLSFVGQSKLFRIPGRPQIEKLADIQRALWSLMNQRLDNLMFLNNAIHTINEDLVDDPDSLEWYPGARWLAHGDAQAAVQMWTPNPTPAQISIPAETMMKADMQNLAGGFPFTSSSEANTVNANTATEASLVASLAQRSIIEAKRHLYECYRRIGQKWVNLNQQFTREPVYAVVVGANDEMEQREILPWMLEGEWAFDVEPMTESLMRQEKRAEALSLFQAIMPSVQIGAATGTLINTRRAYEHVLEAFDIRDTDAWFQQQQPQVPPPGTTPGMGTPPSPENAIPPAGPASGVTNPSLAAGPLAVSNGNSMAPASMMQQMMADNTPSNA